MRKPLTSSIAAALTVLVTLGIGALVVQAAPVPGRSTFDGHTSKWRVTITVSPNGTRLRSMYVQVDQGRCSDSGPYSIVYNNLPDSKPLPGAAGVRIDRNGRFAFSHLVKRSVLRTPGGRNQHGPERITVSGTLSGDSLRGVLRDTLTVGHLHCDTGKVRFTAYRDGSSGAPLRNALVTTGGYAGRDAAGHRMSFQVNLPQALVIGLKVRFSRTCTNGLTVRDGDASFRPIPFAGGGFADNTSATTRAHGLVDHYTARLTGTFLGRSSATGGYAARVAFSFTDHVMRGGRQIGTCSVPQGEVYTLSGPA